MSSQIHHTICVTDQPGELLAFLQSVLGLPVVCELRVSAKQAQAVLGWPPHHTGAQGWMLGRGAAGLLEVFSIPEELLGVVHPGIVMASFAVADLGALADRCEQEGFPPAEMQRFSLPTGDVAAAVVEVGGIRFELTQFLSVSEPLGAGRT